MRYQITERKNVAAPQPGDPKAQAMPRHSGMFDLCDTQRNSVVLSSRNLKWLRECQARWNSKSCLDRWL